MLHYAQDFQRLAQQLKLNLQGEQAKNHYRVTPLGSLHPAWLSPNSVPTLAMDDQSFSYRSLMILGIEGYHDFQPHLLAANLKTLPQFADCEIRHSFYIYRNWITCVPMHVNFVVSIFHRRWNIS